MTAVANLYLKKVEHGDIQIEQVPARWQEEVAEELKKLQNERET